MVSLSVLDLAPVVEGGSVAQTLRNTVALAQLTERRGYRGTGSRSITTSLGWRARRPRWSSGTSRQPLPPFGSERKGSFEPSERLPKPHVMLGVSAVVAESDAEAQLLASSLEQTFVNLRRGRPGRLPPPRAGYRQQLGAVEQALLGEALECALIGHPKPSVKGCARSWSGLPQTS